MKKLLTLLLASALLVPTAVSAFEPNDWVFIRDNDGNGLITGYLPTRATSTAATVCGRDDGDNGAWCYPGRGLKIIHSGWPEHHSNNYDIEVDLTDFSIYDIPDATDIIAAKVSTTTFASEINSLWNALIPYQDIHQTAYGTSTTYSVHHASTTHGMVSKTAWTELTDAVSGFLDTIGTLATVAFSGSWNDLVDKPTLFSGSYNDLTNKPTIPTLPHVESIRAQTNGSGVYTFTFAQPFSTTPVVTLGVEDSNNGFITSVRITSISTTSVTVQTQRMTLLGVISNPQLYVNITAR